VETVNGLFESGFGRYRAESSFGGQTLDVAGAALPPYPSGSIPQRPADTVRLRGQRVIPCRLEEAPGRAGAMSAGTPYAARGSPTRTKLFPRHEQMRLQFRYEYFNLVEPA